MIRKNMPRLVFVMLVVLAILSTVSAFAANIIVPTTRLDEVVNAVDANALKPAQCSAINLTKIVTCTGGNCNGSNSNELIIGSANADSISGKGGRDCILGGDGDDTITGNNGTDICIGGPGIDIFTGCETTIQ